MADAPQKPLPPQATMGLLAYLSTHTLDEDYAYVSGRKAERAGEDPEGGDAPRRRIGAAGAVVMLVFALLVVTAAAQTSRNAVSDEEQRQQLVSQVDDARGQLRDDQARLSALQVETNRLENRQLAGDRAATALREQIQRLGGSAGTLPVRGPGVKVVVDDAPNADEDREKVLDTDLQRLVNGLWQGGAEAITLNGQRLTTLSTIRLAGEAITVNDRSLRRPYTVMAIGDKDTLPARFAETSSGQAWLDLQREVGLQLRITPVDSMRLPATEISALRYANRKAGGTS